MPRKSPTSSPLSRNKKEKISDDNNSDIDDQKDDRKKKKKPIHDKQDVDSDENQSNISSDEDVNDKSDSFVKKRSITVKDKNEKSIKVKDKNTSTPRKTQSSPTTSSTNASRCYMISIAIFSIAVIAIFQCLSSTSPSSSNDIDWRLKVDPNNNLSNNQQNIVRASLKPILDKSSTRQEGGVSTLLILSSDEKSAAKLARCLLELVNKKTNKNQISTEIDLQSHRGGKLTLDKNLRSLLNTTDAIRAVLLRRIDNIPSDDAFEQIRLLFAYCDGENPVIPHRLIIMTATSNSENESELRENFKNRWPNEHDFIDALMSRISGHTLYVEKDQKSIC